MTKNILSVLTQILLVVLFATQIIAQNDCNYKRPKQADTWIFGHEGRLTFHNLEAEANPTTGDYGIPFGSSTMSDENGNLLFFTNGETVYNKAFSVMTNGTGLLGSKYLGQSSIIVPDPASSLKYFVFTTNKYLANYFTEGVRYSVVDFTSNSNGEVTTKNQQVFTENSKVICAVKHDNDQFYWVITHGFGPNKGGSFYSFLIDTSGVAQSPVVSTVGFFQNTDMSDQFGNLIASSDGNKLALTLPYSGIIEIFDFNNATGEVSNATTSSTGQFYYPMGVEFSPDNSKLYATTNPLNADTSYLYQLDPSHSQPFDNRIVIKKMAYDEIETDTLFTTLQLATDGKIYVSKVTHGAKGLPNLGVIYNPDRPGLACNYNELNYTSSNGFYLEGATTEVGLPNFMNEYLDIPHFFYLNQCLNDSTNFIIRNTANLEPTWDFDDAAGTSILADPYSPIHIFSEDGIYEVELTETYDGNDYIFTEQIIINPLPAIDIGQGSNIIYILPGSSITLDAGSGMDIYSWNPGTSDNQYLDVNSPGTYIATVTDFNCCTNSDTVEVVYASLTFPNAFKPGSTISENQKFGVVGNITAINEYQFRIFNRWGQMIFETDDPYEGWDGTINGDNAPMGTYIYAAVFTSFESGIQSSIDIKETGSVTLIR